ncbi:hypothetical protein IU487_35705 [Nocardia puris]|uniref:hypothetical protein n=1 Tax=Nocardia puris TaxID=208602 RepID=UPI001894F31F|nr:hypothetical protein [Nocardia puris]MBF6216337.1 hypothetical protein [Nocardia puris]
MTSAPDTAVPAPIALSSTAAAEAVRDRLVQQATTLAPHRHDPDFASWVAGYREGIEHALHTLRTGGDTARRFLATLEKVQQ